MWTCRSSWCYAHAGWGGWGGMLTFMWTCRSSWCYAHAGWVGGGVGCYRSCELAEAVDVNVWWCDDDADDDDVMMMMIIMMMMTLMKLVNSATKFRHGMDKFYQPNSGLRGSKSRDEAIYTHTCLHAFDFTHRILFDSGWHNVGWVRSRYICQLTSNIQLGIVHVFNLKLDICMLACSKP